MCFLYFNGRNWKKGERRLLLSTSIKPVYLIHNRTIQWRLQHGEGSTQRNMSSPACQVIFISFFMRIINRGGVVHQIYQTNLVSIYMPLASIFSWNQRLNTDGECAPARLMGLYYSWCSTITMEPEGVNSVFWYIHQYYRWSHFWSWENVACSGGGGYLGLRGIITTAPPPQQHQKSKVVANLWPSILGRQAIFFFSGVIIETVGLADSTECGF